MGKIFINKNGKTLVHNVKFVKENSYINTETRLSFLYGDKIVFIEDFQPIDNGDYLFTNCNVECVKGVLNVQNEANYMFSGKEIEKYNNESTPTTVKTSTRLREVDLKCSALETAYMFSHNENLETVKLELPNSTTMNFCFDQCVKLKNVSLIAPNVQSCNYTFEYCTSLQHIDISSLVNCTSYDNLFNHCSNLVSVTLPALSSGTKAAMFRGCSSLQSVEINLQGSTSGFATTTFEDCSSIHTISGDWSKLSTIISNSSNNYTVFDDCTALQNFNADISGIAIGDELFYNCVSLENFTSSLASLTTGVDMFLRCKLNLQSVTNIINSIMTENTTGGSAITLGVDKNIKNDVTSFFENIGRPLEEFIDGTIHNISTTITNAAGNTWIIYINWN